MTNLLFDAATLRGPSGESGLLPIKEQALKCQKCQLHSTRKNVVFGEGKADSPFLMIVGEAPGQTEDLQGKPFVGTSGELLNKLLSTIGLKREDIYIANVVKCRPPENRRPEPLEIASCIEYLTSQIRVVRPTAILALGVTAAQALSRSRKPIGELRGRWFEVEGIPLRATYHPAFILRTGKMHMKEYETDFTTVKLKIREILTKPDLDSIAK